MSNFKLDHSFFGLCCNRPVQVTLIPSRPLSRPCSDFLSFVRIYPPFYTTPSFLNDLHRRWSLSSESRLVVLLETHVFLKDSQRLPYLLVREDYEAFKWRKVQFSCIRLWFQVQEASSGPRNSGSTTTSCISSSSSICKTSSSFTKQSLRK